MNGTLLVRPKVFRPYVASHCRGLTERSHVALVTHELQSLEIWSKSVGNEGLFTREAESLSSPSRLAFQRGDRNVTPGTPSTFATSSIGLVEIGRNEGHFTEKPEQFSVRISLRIAATWWKSLLWNPLPMGYKKCSFRRNRTVTKGTSLLMRTVFCPYHASPCCGIIETSHLALAPYALQAMQVWSKSVGNEDMEENIKTWWINNIIV
jgi:hypothetical protein